MLIIKSKIISTTAHNKVASHTHFCCNNIRKRNKNYKIRYWKIYPFVYERWWMGDGFCNIFCDNDDVDAKLTRKQLPPPQKNYNKHHARERSLE